VSVEISTAQRLGASKGEHVFNVPVCMNAVEVLLFFFLLFLFFWNDPAALVRSLNVVWLMPI